jgi:hypothetical protein
MHPMVAYDLAKLKIEESHRIAARERLLRPEAEPPAARFPTTRLGGTSLRARVAAVLTLGGLLG